MIISSKLIEQLSLLTLSLDNPGTDLGAVLDVLTDDLTAAIPSFLGLTMTLHQVGGAVTLTAIDRALALTAGASLEIPLAGVGGSGSGAGSLGTMVCYARQAGSFVDLAADTGLGCHVDGRVAVSPGLWPGRTVGPKSRVGPDGLAQPDRAHARDELEPHHVTGSGHTDGSGRLLSDPAELAELAELAGISGLGELTLTNRAIGVLISRGYSPAEAHTELLHRVALCSLSLPEVARQVLRSTNAPPPGPRGGRMPPLAKPPLVAPPIIAL